MEKIKAILIVKDHEPNVVEIENSRDAFIKIINESLSEKEKSLSECNGLDFFSSKINNIGGMVEEYSACHSYDRNRDWHGPALFTEQDESGKTISMKEDNIKAMIDTYSLDNYSIKSPSKVLNEMLNKYGDAIIFNYSKGGHMAVLNTYDAKDILLRTRDKNIIDMFEKIFICIQLEARGDENKIKEDVTEVLKDVCIQIFKQQIAEYEALGF